MQKDPRDDGDGGGGGGNDSPSVAGINVSTSSEIEILGNTAKVKGTINVTNGSVIVLDFGFVYAPASDYSLNINSSNLVPGDFSSFIQNTSYTYTCTINGLKAREWKYRAFATIIKDSNVLTVYGEILQFTITDGSGSGGGDNTISLNISSIEDFGADYANCTATIVSSQQISDPQTFFANAQCGFCYCLGGNTPTIDNNKLDCTSAAFSSNNGSFSGKITNLQPKTQYVVRAYFTQNGTTVYSEERYFQTREKEEKDSITLTCTNTSSTSLTFSVVAIVNSQDLPTAGGLCYSTTATPTINNSTILDCMAQAAAGDGRFTATIQNLSPETAYHVRGFMTLGKETIYSNEVIGTTTASKK